MGYFDALTSGYEDRAGRTQVVLSVGRIGPRLHHRLEQDYERLRRQVKAYTIVSLVLIVGVQASTEG